MRNIFKNDELQKQFDEKGFVKLSMLEKEEVENLRNYYIDQEFDNKIEAGFHISLDNQNEELVKEVGSKIKDVLVPKTSELLDDCQIFTASFVIKEPGLQNIVPPHQDWTFVDEDQYCSATVWTALVDVSEQNGALGVIPGSHKIFNHKRSSPSPQSKSPLADHIFTLFPFVEVIDMKAGESLIFDNRLIHASPPNFSDQARIAVGIGITQSEAKLKHFYQNPSSGKLEEYDVDQGFYTWFNNKRLSDLFDSKKSPEGLNKVGEFERVVPDLSKEEMEARVQELEGVEYNKPFMERLAKLFNYSMDGEQKEAEANQQDVETEIQKEWKDERTFLQKYSLRNILREIVWRFRGKPNMN
ncbi:MAG: phytanoyl-CoA dioxygenase family protein [Crocinitomicaceae bacterium]|nr:phytanoyl-CoA dioxygenase family protein [Crocinitomicaceae bacterium]